MKPIKLSSAAALVIATTLVGAVNAQTASPSGSDQDHESHHPPAASEAPTGAPTQPSTQSQTGPGGMMGPGMMGQDMMGPGMMGQSCMGGTTGQNSSTGMMCMRDMMSMMGNMMNMMGVQSGMMASNIEGRITTLKTEFKITDAQTPAWNRFAEALRATAGSMNAMYEKMMQSGTALPARLERRETMLTAHLNRVKTLKEALDPLYASFSDEQKKIANGVMIGPMGMM